MPEDAPSDLWGSGCARSPLEAARMSNNEFRTAEIGPGYADTEIQYSLFDILRFKKINSGAAVPAWKDGD
jgi:hypothetical protein